MTRFARFMKRVGAALLVLALVGVEGMAGDLAQGEVVRLGMSLRGRSSPQFRGMGNVKFGISAGTKAEVLQIRRYPNGGAAVQVKILMGPNRGKTAWVYQNRQGTYLTQDKKETPKPVEVDVVTPIPPPLVDPAPVVKVRTVDTVSVADCPPEQPQPMRETEVKALMTATDRVLAADFTTQAPRSRNIRCQPLEVGQSRSLNVPSHESPTTVEARYRLARISANEYQVTLNPVFRDRRNTREGDAAVQALFRKRVQACFNVANRAMVGPNGQKLKLALAQPGPEENQVPPVEIEIYSAQGGAVDRNNSAQYKEDIECPTIIHEMLHLLGLCDEYEEKWMGKRVDASGNILASTDGASKYKYDCRAVGPDDSIMNDNGIAFRSMMSTWKPFIFTCSCSTNACRKALASWSPYAGDCPKGAKLSNNRMAREDEVDRASGATRIDENTVEFSMNGDRWGIRRSLLRPAHFNAIVHPGCAVNDDFYGCSKEAYLDATGPGRQGCGELPAACKNGNQSWIGDPIQLSK